MCAKRNLDACPVSALSSVSDFPLQRAADRTPVHSDAGEHPAASRRRSVARRTDGHRQRLQTEHHRRGRGDVQP